MISEMSEISASFAMSSARRPRIREAQPTTIGFGIAAVACQTPCHMALVLSLETPAYLARPVASFRHVTQSMSSLARRRALTTWDLITTAASCKAAGKGQTNRA